MRLPDEWSIPDDLSQGIKVLLPEHEDTHRFGGGRPPARGRLCMEAILDMLRADCQWKDVNATR